MTRNHWRRSAAGAFALALCVTAHLAAQTEGGVARDARTGAPLECLHVALVDSADRAVAHTVTDATGQFLLEASHAGPYRVRFEIGGWEPLAGPLDTLADGGFKQRRYPLDFVNDIRPKPRRPGSPPDTSNSAQAQHDREQRAAYLGRLREESAGWTGRKMLPQGGPIYPDGLRLKGVEGSVIGQLIVDSTGRARVDTWQPISASHPDFEKAVRSSLKEWRWTPAKLAGKAACELVRGDVEFQVDTTRGSRMFANLRNTGHLIIGF